MKEWGREVHPHERRRTESAGPCILCRQRKGRVSRSTATSIIQIGWQIDDARIERKVARTGPQRPVRIREHGATVTGRTLRLRPEKERLPACNRRGIRALGDREGDHPIQI